MAVSIYKIKKWFNMLNGTSVHHVNQSEGKVYSKTNVSGYYNNLTEKVSRFGLPGTTIPKSFVDSGEEIYFAIEIFQYGLGAYDIYLLENDKSMLEKAVACADWAVDNITENGGWKTFAHKTPDHPYSSMAQGEGISLLTRIYKETTDNKYLQTATKAVAFMIKTVDVDGTAVYSGEDILFKEFACEPLVLNGWIFSLWGLFDYYKLTNDSQIKEIYDKSVATLVRYIPLFDIGYWSKYDFGKRICSPFYHRLHIAQLNVMYDLTGINVFKEYSNKWKSYQDSSIKRKRAFFAKAVQKIFE